MLLQIGRRLRLLQRVPHRFPRDPWYIGQLGPHILWHHAGWYKFIKRPLIDLAHCVPIVDVRPPRIEVATEAGATILTIIEVAQLLLL